MANRSLFDHPVSQYLRCPRTGRRLQRDGDRLVAVDGDADVDYPIVGDIPVLFNSERSVFSAEPFLKEAATVKEDASPAAKPRLRHRLYAMLPRLGRNQRGHQNLQAFAHELPETTPNPVVLVLGGGILGVGMRPLAANPNVDLVESDVYIGPRTQILLDAHEIPFDDATFDGVIIQGVFGLLLDPIDCVAEIHRVLKPEGLVYAEVPFIQQVIHPADCHRFTHLGFLHLFKNFEEITSGAQGGPAMALAWSWLYFLLSLTSTRRGRVAAHVFARLTAWWLPQVDRLLIERPAALDGASGVFFLGRRSEETLSDAELLQQYRGMTPGPTGS